MDAQTAGLVLGGLVVLTTIAGLLIRAREGRAKMLTHTTWVTPEQLGLRRGDLPFGSSATLVQFSSEFCTKCPATRVLLAETAAAHPGVRHIDIDVTNQPDIANRFSLMQTPTTLVLDEAGIIAARIGGAPRPDALARALNTALRRDHGNYTI
jgi:thiol-disulfide isomerase/thioredoxin